MMMMMISDAQSVSSMASTSVNRIIWIWLRLCCHV